MKQQRRPPAHQRTAMIMFLYMFAFILLTTGGVDALTCYCSDCGARECQGNFCYAQVARDLMSGDYLRRWRCYDHSHSHLCNSSSAFHNTVCCQADRCNEGLMPELLSGTASPMQLELTESMPEELTGSSPSTASPIQTEPTGEPAATSATNSILAPILNPHLGGNEIPTSPDSEPPPSPLLAESCYESDSLQGVEIRLCMLEQWCYSLWRRRSDGSVRLRRGCATSCKPERRNRKVKTCCTTSLCNHDLRIEGSNNNTNVPGRIVPPTLHSELPTTPPPSPSSPSVVPPVIEPESSVTTPSRATHPPSVHYCNCSNDVRCTSRFCTSSIGCATQTTNINGNTVIAQICISNGSMCLVPGTECCQGHLCNHPRTASSSPSTQPTQATTGPPTVHITSNTRSLDSDTPPMDDTTSSPPITSTTTPPSLLHSPTTSTSAIPPTTPTSLTSNRPSEGPRSESPILEEEELSIYYIMTILISVIAIATSLGIVALCLFLCVNHSKEKSRFLSKAQTTPATV